MGDVNMENPSYFIDPGADDEELIKDIKQAHVRQWHDETERLKEWARELLKRVEYTVSVHGHMDCGTPLHDAIAEFLYPADSSRPLNEHAECTLRACPNPDACFEMCKLHRKASGPVSPAKSHPTENTKDGA
jgi:hypothetical protein